MVVSLSLLIIILAYNINKKKTIRTLYFNKKRKKNCNYQILKEWETWKFVTIKY